MTSPTTTSRASSVATNAAPNAAPNAAATERPRPRRGSFGRRLLRRALSPLVALLVPLSLSLVPAVTVHAATTTYYVDCGGSDTNSGTSATSPWRTLSKANNAYLGAGSTLLLKRGCTWTGPLTAKWTGTGSAPVTIGAYGTGNLPLIQGAHENVAITGSYQLIEDIATKGIPSGYDSSCQNWPTGWQAGFRFFSGAAYNTVRNSSASYQYIGMLLEGGSHDNHLIGNTLTNNNMKDPNTSSDAGAVAITFMGDHNEAGWNYISGSNMCSELYGWDGAAVEVYGGQYNNIHHNTAWQNNNFTELGNSRSLDNTYAYNQVYSSLTDANFLVTRGPKDTAHGPVYGTKVYNSSVYLSGSSAYAVQCTGGCSSSVLSFRNNIVWSNWSVGYSDAAFDEGNDVYWASSGSPKIWFPTNSSDRIANPQWVSTSTPDLHLQSTSPAVNAGSNVALNLGYNTDLDGTSVPQGSAVDIGAHEYTSGTITAASTGTTYVSDGFSRTVSNGWGSAGTGGAYTIEGTASDFAVNGSSGTMHDGAGVMRAATLQQASARDVNATFRVKTDKSATGSGNYAYFVARRSMSAGNEYRVKVRFAPNGLVYMQATRVISNAETALGSEVSSGVTAWGGTWVRVRAQVVGTAPTTIRIKVWLDGTAEPSSWQYTTTDSTSALQSSGVLGLRSYLSASATNAPVLFSFDDWSVTAP